VALKGYAIGQIDPSGAGIHLMWAGPGDWPWAPSGWTIQRRSWQPTDDMLVCETVAAQALALLRYVRVQLLQAGVLTFVSVPPSGPDGHVETTGAGFVLPPRDVYRLRLNPAVRAVRLNVTAQAFLACAVQAGKVVATQVGTTATGQLWFATGEIDEIVVTAVDMTAFEICRLVPGPAQDENDWSTRGVTLVQNLRLPIAEADPGLASLADELAAARARLLPGETLDQADFVRAMAPLRVIVQGAGRDGAKAAPGDLALLMTTAVDARPQELRAVSMIQALALNPRWRRILGMAWFDTNGLTPGSVYEYRVIGDFPRRDLEGRRYDFRTVPSATSLPERFCLGDTAVTLAQPAVVALADGISPGNLTIATRRGIALDSIAPAAGWTAFAALSGWAAVFDLPYPVSVIDIELANGGANPSIEIGVAIGAASTLTSVAGLAWSERLRIGNVGQIGQVALRGTGLLTGLRISSTDDVNDTVPAIASIPAITFTDAPRAAPPVTVGIANLQRPSEPPTTTDDPQPVPARHALGFEVAWLPAPPAGLTSWPMFPLLPPPLDAFAHQIEHREAATEADVGAASYAPVLPGDNWVFATRAMAPRDTSPLHGADLMALFPETAPPPVGVEMSWRDVFNLLVDDAHGEPARVAHPGTFHQYRVRAVDAVGRPGTAWTESAVLRLEKHYPPPLPPGPTRPPPEGAPRPPGPSGVQARLLVPGDDGMTADEQNLLGTSQDAIVVEWGWSDDQRAIDPTTAEFRVYTGPRRDLIPGQVTSSTPLGAGPGMHDVLLDLEQEVRADAAAGSFLISGGYPFFIDTHAAGRTAVPATVSALVPRTPPVAPIIGPTALRLRYTPDMTRPPGWTRVAVKTIADIEPGAIDDWKRYRVVLRDVMGLSPTTPEKTIWVGVSAADAEAYVPDQLDGPNPRPGNESALATVTVRGRYRLQPSLTPPVDLVPVPRIGTPEPANRPVSVTLDLTSYLPAGFLTAGELVRVERADGDELAGALEIDANGGVVASVVEPAAPTDTAVPLTFPAPVTAAVTQAITQALTTSAPLDDRYVVYLANLHPYRDRLFTTVNQNPVPLGSLADLLPPRAGRWVYRFRRAHPSGVVSAEGLVARVVVRVPSLAAGAAPDVLSRTDDDQLHGLLRLRVPPDPQVTHVLVFAQVGGAKAATVRTTSAAPEPVLLRVPNPSPALAPEQRIKLRLGGDLLTPFAKAVGDPELVAETADAGSAKLLSVAVVPAIAGTAPLLWRLGGVTATPADRVRVWACTLSADGVPSGLAGPFGVGVPIAAGGP
jgi:hypothetical protein